MSNKFRPQDNLKRWTMKLRLEKHWAANAHNYNFQTRVRWYPVGYKLNHLTLSRIHGRLHYLAAHSPKTVATKYKVVYNRFMAKHSPSTKASFRYMDTWGTRLWL